MKWFVFEDELVSGPFLTEEIKNLFSQGTYSENAMIWSRAQNHWLSVQQWQDNVDELIVKSKDFTEIENWHYAFNGNSYGPFTRKDLLHQIKNHNADIGELLLWTTGMKDWAPVFEFLDIVDELGINARQHPRAPILGTAVVQSPTEPNVTIMATLETISEGGLGIKGATDLPPGKIVTLEISSEQLYNKIKVEAEVRYISSDGFVGLRFSKISAEAKSAIIQFVRTYIKDQSAARKAS